VALYLHTLYRRPAPRDTGLYYYREGSGFAAWAAPPSSRYRNYNISFAYALNLPPYQSGTRVVHPFQLKVSAQGAIAPSCFVSRFNSLAFCMAVKKLKNSQGKETQGRRRGPNQRTKNEFEIMMIAATRTKKRSPSVAIRPGKNRKTSSRAQI